jgi:hypothetical protein
MGVNMYVFANLQTFKPWMESFLLDRFKRHNSIVEYEAAYDCTLENLIGHH